QNGEVGKKENLDDIPKLKYKGNYLVTGGTGKIGYLLAEYLARTFKAGLILTGRTPMPPQEQWEKWHEQHGEDDPVTKKIRKLEKLQQMGARVLHYSVDIADRDQMQQVVTVAETQLGPVNGIIHAAGETGPTILTPVQQAGIADCEAQFKPKVQGLQVLEYIFRDRDLDFCYLTSSLAPILGGLGFAAYSAANLYMDAYVYENRKKSPVHWISVNWADWQFQKGGERANALGESVETLSMTPEEGLDTFRRIMRYLQGNQVIVSAGDLQARFDTWVKLETLRGESEEGETGERTLHRRPQLETDYDPPTNHIEKTIAAIWEKMFRFEPVGIGDDFFEMGGDSLKAITVIAKIHKELNVVITLAEFFDTPNIAALAQYTANAEESTYQAVEAVEKKEYYVLSSAQKRLYILQQMEEDSVGYNETDVVILEGTPHRERLENTFKQLIRRHDILRTSIHMIGGEPYQRVHEKDEIEFKLRYIEAEPGSSGDNAKQIAELIRPFDMSTPLWLRVGLIKQAEQKYTLVIDMHHTATDGVSSVLFVKEFMDIYYGAQYPPLKLQYKDYAVWQNKQKQNGELEKQERYWKEQFKGENPILNLPYDKSRPGIQSFEGRRVGFGIEPGETAALRKQAARHGVTLYMVLLAAFNIFLEKISGQEDIITGTQVAGRAHADLQQIMGIFINTLAIRTQPAEEKTFKQYLAEVKERALKAFENQDYQFEDLIEKVAVERDLARSPLLDVMFILQNIDAMPKEIPEERLQDFTLTPCEHENHTSKLDLTLIGSDRGDTLHFTIEYSTKLFIEETIQRFIAYFTTILKEINKEPEAIIGEIEVITPKEKQQILHEFNETRTEYPANKTVIREFEEQAAKKPDKIALVARTRVINHPQGKGTVQQQTESRTYREMERKAARLAARLKKEGVIPGDIVALIPERTQEMMEGLLAILKTGAAYLPIGPEYPPDRVDSMLADSAAKLILVNGRWDTTLTAPQPKLRLPMQKEEEPQPIPVQQNGRPTDPVYVNYTSGTTGKPKGVVIENRAVLNFIKGITAVIPFGPETRLYALTTISFDIFGLETLLPLTGGSTIVLGTREEQLDVQTAARVIHLEKINIFQVTPSRLRLQLTDKPSAESLARLKYLLVGGEAFPQPLLEEVRQVTPAEIVNLYGPTETTIWSTQKDLTGEKELNIGKPIANTRIYILNKANKPQPPGIAGELCIAGDGVAKGYLNRVQLTAQRFITEIIEGKKERMYRTGDLARWLPDGNIQYLGRMDYQVKLRGFRIELGEIETLLAGHENIGEAVVTAVGTEDNKYLCAYLVLKKENGIAQIRTYLEGKLPEYMLPSYYVPIETMPLTSNGKIDRKNLPAPEVGTATAKTTGVQYQAPTNETEERITGIWREILEIEKPGINDDFFQVGGNSLKLIQIYNQLNQHYPGELKVHDLFDKRTIKEVSEYLEQKKKTPETGETQKEIIDVEF
ncbi:MAG: amino acid adenylation domain-containing protein, partial [bacterium]|nr:amino acid adenylation domain-containing protein [bacterium]